MPAAPASDTLRARIRELAREKIAPHVRRAEERREVPTRVREAMAEAGCFGRLLPREFGGSEAGLTAFAVQQEELAKVWPTAAVVATWTALSGTLLSRFGSPGQKETLLRPTARGEAFGAVGWTEPHGGSDAAAIRTTAKRVAGGWVLNGEKRLIDNAANADFIIVGARTDPDAPPRKGISMFVVHRDDPGFVFGGGYDTLGLRAAGVGWFELRDCFVPDSRLLGGLNQGFYQMMAMVEVGRTGVAALCLGIATAALDATVAFLRDRHSFGRPLSQNDAILATVADLRIRLDAARLLTERATALFDAGVRCSTQAAIAKVAASELANDATAAALQLHGGIGYTSRLPIEMLFRDSRAFTIGEGTSEVLRLLIGREEFARDRT